MLVSWNARALTRVGYAGRFITGLVSVIVAPALPFLISEYRLSLSAAGLIFLFRSVGLLGGNLLGGLWSDRSGRRPVVVAGAAVQAAGLAGMVVAPSWILVLLLFCAYGIGSGMLGAGLDALVAEVNPHRRAAALNQAHGIYGLGALLGPLGAGFALAAALSWRLVFTAGAGLWLSFALLAVVQMYPPPATPSAHPFRELHAILADKVIFLLFMVAFLYNGVATGLVNWINALLTTEGRMGAAAGAAMISVFYAALTAGRLAGGAAAHRLGHLRLILVSAAGVCLFFPLAVFARHPFPIALGVALSGLFCATLYPTALAHAGLLRPTRAGAVAAVMSAGLALGAMVVPWLIGCVGDLTGSLQVGMAFAAALAAVLLGVAIRLTCLGEAGRAGPTPPKAITDSTPRRCS
jgi:FHS family glucose/mannose:H+ symporter-like MFS transporter